MGCRLRAGGAAVFAGVVIMLAHRAEPMLRARIVEGLAEHFHARVELDSFHLSLRDGLWVEGKGLQDLASGAGCGRGNTGESRAGT